MSRRDLMRDPAFSGLLHAIETQLHACDQEATARGFVLTDSNIRSLLVRAVNEAKGKVPKASGATPSGKDGFLLEAHRELTKVRTDTVEEHHKADGSVQRQPLQTADWIAALEAIKESCEVRTGSEAGSRGYLEFVRGFLEQAKRPPGE